MLLSSTVAFHKVNRVFKHIQGRGNGYSCFYALSDTPIDIKFSASGSINRLSGLSVTGSCVNLWVFGGTIFMNPSSLMRVTMLSLATLRGIFVMVKTTFDTDAVGLTGNSQTSPSENTPPF